MTAALTADDLNLFACLLEQDIESRTEELKWTPGRGKRDLKEGIKDVRRTLKRIRALEKIAHKPQDESEPEIGTEDPDTMSRGSIEDEIDNLEGSGCLDEMEDDTLRAYLLKVRARVTKERKKKEGT